MIKVEGFRAFHGTMRITPVVRLKSTWEIDKPIKINGTYSVRTSNNEPFEITCDWLYKPEYKCWYGQGRSFPEEICEVVRDDTEKKEGDDGK